MHDFKKLQEKWYGILRESGFVDIETKKHNHIYRTERGYLELDPVRRAAKEEYYRLINLAISDENVTFRNKTDYYIMLRHAEGVELTEIMRELEQRKTPKSKKGVRMIIRRYEMAWNIRFYNRRQLNLKG